MPMPLPETELLAAHARIAFAVDGLGLRFGAFALDVGGRDGAMVPLIRALGVGRVAIVDPDTASLARAVTSGVVESKDVYPVTLEEYITEGHRAADAAFVFNMQPRLANNAGFIRALGSAVRPQGLVVTSFMEPITALQFSNNVQSGEHLQRMDVVMPSQHATGSHAYMHLYQAPAP